MKKIDEYLDAHRERFEEELCRLLSVPSVSTDKAYAGEVRRAAEWLVDHFRSISLKAELVETRGQPIVFAESPKIDGAPTVLIYGHYDVQPPDPLDLWESPPFEPTKRDGNLYARGATDDKGQMFTHVKSAQAWVEAEGRLPVQLKYIIEGEEEVGSSSLLPFIKTERHRLSCDVVVISDTAQFAPGQPAVTYGLRGIAYFELSLSGPSVDLHSGTFGGSVSNPATALAKMLSALVDQDGRIQVPGFYDDIEPLSEKEKAALAALPFDETRFKKQLGVDALSGEKGYSTLERRWVRPSFDVNGLTAGYQGEGAKTVLPAAASAKFSFRLAPGQDPGKIKESLEKQLRALCPPGVSMTLTDLHSSPGVVVPIDSPYMAAAARAIEEGFGTAPVFIREGGSIPVVTDLHEILGADVLLLGWGLDDDNTHSPNEKFSLADFHKGIRSSAHLWQHIAEL